MESFTCLDCREDEFINIENGVIICRNCDSTINFTLTQPEQFFICQCPSCYGGSNYCEYNTNLMRLNELIYILNSFRRDEEQYIDNYTDNYINNLFNESSCELKRNEKIKVDVESKIYSQTLKTFTNCTICSDEYKDDDTVSILNCSHIFHKDCIQEWGHYNPVCPVCKDKIKVND